jgi:hypothetical protein
MHCTVITDHMIKVGRPDFILPKESEIIFLPPFASHKGEQMYRTVFKLNPSPLLASEP